jgi:hypothetical protein
MHKHVGHPGTWQQFLRRTDNTRIPIEEARQKYLKEQFYYDRWMATSQPALYGAGASAGSNAAFVGQGIDGPISGATVKVFNASNALVTTTTTNGVGAFTLDFVPTSMSFELTGGTDTVTGIAFTGTLKAPAGSTIISPITTAIKEVMDNHNTSEADATDYIFNFAREIYGIDVPANARERAKTENFITLAETDADMLKVTGLASFLESSAEIAGQALEGQVTDATLKLGKEQFYRSLAGLAHNYKSATAPGSRTNFDSFGAGSTLGRQIRESVIRGLGDSSRSNTVGFYNTFESSLQDSLDRVREIVNDADVDKEYGVATIFAQNRVVKQDMKSLMTSNGRPGTLAQSSSILVETKETEVINNLGTIFSGKPIRNRPSATRFPEKLNYISGSTNSQLNFGDLTRAGEFNGTAQYTGVIDGETTLVWFDTTGQSWVIDNNLTLPAIATAAKRQAYPLAGQIFNTIDRRQLQLFTSGSAVDGSGNAIPNAPAGSGRYINSFAFRPPVAAGRINGIINWSSITLQIGGISQRIWHAQGDIYLGTLDMGATLANGRVGGIKLSGNFRITNNLGPGGRGYSELYVVTKLPEEDLTITINNAIPETVTSLNLGFQLNARLLGPAITTTGGFNPSVMNNIAGIFTTE